MWQQMIGNMKVTFSDELPACFHHTVVRALVLSIAFAWTTKGPLLSAGNALMLEHDPLTGAILLEWNLDGELPDGDYQIEWSDDLENWEVLHELGLGPSSTDAVPSHFLVQEPPVVSFYRLVQRDPGIVDAFVSTGEDGADLYGFSARFEENLEAIGEISIDDFLDRYERPEQFVETLSYDPVSAEFLAPVTSLLSESKFDHDSFQRIHPVEFTVSELERIAKNGFVVSGRLGHRSFLDSYYQIFVRDLPVFVSLDSILQAWTQAYRSILQETETYFLSPEVNQMIVAMREQMPLIADGLNSDLEASLNDVDLYLAVAATLGTGRKHLTTLGRGDMDRALILGKIGSFDLDHGSLFGRKHPEIVDYSEFKPRGHYTSSDILRRYFQLMTWLGRIDFRVAGSGGFASPRELGAAVILREALIRSGYVETWKTIDRILRTFVGLPYSMTVPQLTAIMESAGLSEGEGFPLMSELLELQEQIESSTLGGQEIQSHSFFSAQSRSIKLPRSFSLFGQRFGMDSWALDNLVFDKVFWEGQQVGRRLPSGVDIAFTVMDNAAAVPVLASRIRNRSGVPFRDGFPIQHHLGALHGVFDQLKDEGWKDNLYTAWIHTLRLWSQPVDESIPEVFRTREWALRTMNSQLASWSHLRHNTVLYTKRSVSGDVLCSFPHTYLEPNLAAWGSITAMARRLASDLAEIGTPDGISDRHITFLNRFGDTVARLTEIVRKQNRREPLSLDENSYLKDMVELMIDYDGRRSYSGWYPRLYYVSRERQDNFLEENSVTLHPGQEWDAVVSDIHTDLPSVEFGDQGTILHQGVGNTAMLFVSVNCTENRMYVGPVSTYYEFTSGSGDFDRISNGEWKDRLTAGNQPAEPEWTHGHRVPLSGTLEKEF